MQTVNLRLKYNSDLKDSVCSQRTNRVFTAVSMKVARNVEMAWRLYCYWGVKGALWQGSAFSSLLVGTPRAHNM